MMNARGDNKLDIVFIKKGTIHCKGGIQCTKSKIRDIQDDITDIAEELHVIGDISNLRSDVKEVFILNNSSNMF